MNYDVVLIDGKNALHRAHHTAKELTTTVDGETVSIGAAYQFLRIVLSTLERKASSKRFLLVVAWEGGPELERHRQFEGYKRRERNPDIERQCALLQDRILPTLGWCQASSTGWEADDVLGTISRIYEAKDRRVGILSGDMDMHQVVSDFVHVISPQPRPDLDDGVTWRPRDVRRRWSNPAHKVPEIKALCGDSGDGIPGCPGVGEEWARGLISHYGSLEGVIRQAKLDPKDFGYEGEKGHRRSPAKAKAIVEHEEKIRLYWQLCTLNRYAPLTFIRRQDGSGTRRLLAELRFASLLAHSTLTLIDAAAGRSMESA